MKRKLEKHIQASARAVSAWSSVAADAARQTPVGMRPAFVAHRMACALAEVEELLAVHSSLWPEEIRWRQRFREPIVEGLLQNAKFLRSGIEVAHEEQPESGLARSQDSGDLYAFFCQVRRSIKYFSGLSDGDPTVRHFDNSIDDALESIRALDRTQKFALETALTSLLYNSFLILDARLPNGDSLSERYLPLVRAVRLLRGETSMNLDEICRTLDVAGIKPETRDRVNAFIDALRRALSDYDIDRIREILADGGHLFPGIGDGGDIVVIPGHGPGHCAPIVLAIAQGRDGRSRYSLPNVMREVRAHLIRCFEIAEVVILLTDRWDPDLMKESVPDFSAYASRSVGRKVLIPIVSWKRQLTTFEWP